MVRAGGQRPSHLLLICWICILTKISGAQENQGEHCTTSDGRPGICVLVKYCREAVAVFPYQLPTVCYQKGPHPFACCPIPDVDPLSEAYTPNQPRVDSSINTRTVNTFLSTGETPWSATTTSSYDHPRYPTLATSRTENVYKPSSRDETFHSTKTRNHYPRDTRYEPPTRTYSTDDTTYRQPGSIRPTKTYYSSTEPYLQPSTDSYSTGQSRYKPSVVSTDEYYPTKQYEPSTQTTKYITEDRETTGSYPRGSSRTKHVTNYPRYEPPSVQQTKSTLPRASRTSTRHLVATEVPQYEKDRSESHSTRKPNLEASRSYHQSARETYIGSSRSYVTDDYGLSREGTGHRPQSSSRVPQIEISKTEIRYYNPTDYSYPSVTTERRPATVSTPSKHGFPTQTQREGPHEYDNPSPQRPKPTFSAYLPSKNNRSSLPILSEAGCGEPILEMFIAGGQESRPGDWPFMVAVYRMSPPGRTNKFICGGVLINRRHILSAAHCFASGNKTLPASLFIVRLGAHDRDTTGEDHLISRLVIHEDYVSRFHDHDIAILYLMNTVPYTKLIQPVCLPGPDHAHQDFVGEKATVIGWGDVSLDGGYSTVLNEVLVSVVSNKQCFASYARLRSSSFPRGNMEQYICAGQPEGGKDACQGDSGGPLLVKGNDGRWIAIGIVSFGFRCAEPGFPGVYSRIFHYLTWIERKIYNI